MKLTLRIVVLLVLVLSNIEILFAQAPNVQWQKYYGGGKEDAFHTIIQTSDEGFAVAGYSYSSDGHLDTNMKFRDAWIAKLDKLGGLVWSRSFGGSNDDMVYQIIQ